MKNKTSTKNKKMSIKEKALKEGNLSEKMGAFGKGQGYFGISKTKNVWMRFILIWMVFGYLSYYLFMVNQIWQGFIAIASGVMFSLFNNVLRD